MTVNPVLWKIAVTIVFAVVLWGLYRVSYFFLARGLRIAGKEFKAPNTTRTILLVFYGLIGIFGVLEIFGLSVTPLLASLGIGGIVVGLALQEPLANLFSGILILTTGAVKEGETIGVGDDSGTVEAVRMNHTLIRTWDGKLVLVPNRIVWNSRIVHFWPGEARRLEFTVGIPYDADLEAAERALWKAIRTSETVVQELGNNVIFKGFGPSSIDYNIYIWFRREDWGKVQNEIARRVVECLEEEGISIPFPQLDLHIKNGGTIK